MMTDNFIAYLLSLTRDTIPLSVYKHARACFLDYIAVTLCGAGYNRKKMQAYTDGMGACVGCAGVLGMNHKTDMQTAALINGMNSHAIELDDGHRQGALHVGGTIFSALLAVAEKENLSSQDFLYGAIIGYEVSVRMACAVQPGNKLRGYHATGTCGTIGAAMGIAAALGFDKEQMKSALSAAATCAAGLLEMQEDNSDYKQLNVGRAAMDAVAAAYLGKAGFVPPFDALGGRRGFLKVMTDVPKIKYLTEFEDSPLAITQVYMKTYASCRHTHPAIEAALKLRKEHDLVPQQIASIAVESYSLAVSGHDHTKILGISSAKMSLPFGVALALCTGSAGMDAYNDANITDETILSLTKMVKVIESSELSALVPQKRSSILHLTLTDSSELTCRIDYPKGEPENPLTDEELREKFMSLAMSGGFSKERCLDVLNTLQEPSYVVTDLMEKLK